MRDIPSGIMYLSEKRVFELRSRIDLLSEVFQNYYTRLDVLTDFCRGRLG